MWMRQACSNFFFRPTMTLHPNSAGWKGCSQRLTKSDLRIRKASTIWEGLFAHASGFVDNLIASVDCSFHAYPTATSTTRFVIFHVKVDRLLTMQIVSYFLEEFSMSTNVDDRVSDSHVGLLIFCLCSILNFFSILSHSSFSSDSTFSTHIKRRSVNPEAQIQTSIQK